MNSIPKSCEKIRISKFETNPKFKYQMFKTIFTLRQYSHIADFVFEFSKLCCFRFYALVICICFVLRISDFRCSMFA